MSFRLDSSSLLVTLFHDGLFHDVEVTLENQRFHLHKAILSRLSPRFHRLFTKYKHEGTQEVDLSDDTDVSYEVLKTFLGYFYGLPITLTLEYLTDISFLAKYFKVSCLSTACSTFALDSSANIVSLDPQEILSSIHTERNFCDYTINHGDHAFPLHKSVLASSCELFSKLWENDDSVTQYDLLPNNVSSSNLKQFLSSLYGQEIEINLENAYDLFCICTNLICKPFSQKVEEIITENLDQTQWILTLLEKADAENNCSLITIIDPFVQKLSSSKSKLSAIVLKPSTLLNLSSVDIDWRIESLVKSYSKTKEVYNWNPSLIESLIESFCSQTSDPVKVYSILVEPWAGEDLFVELLLKYSVLFLKKVTDNLFKIPAEWFPWCISVAEKLNSSLLGDVIAICNACQKVINPVSVRPSTFDAFKVTNVQWKLESLMKSYFDPLMTSSWSYSKFETLLVNTITNSIVLPFAYNVVVKKLYPSEDSTRSNFN
ncbi:hypothetical protein GEMRC1_009354 [Eukaryota sp. GEM-RC1]